MQKVLDKAAVPTTHELSKLEVATPQLSSAVEIVPQMYKMGATFNLPEIGDSVEVLGAKAGLRSVPRSNPFYEFEVDSLRDMTMFWTSGEKAAKLEGDPSAGKDSLVFEWHSRLNWPLFVVPGSPDLAKVDLLGQMMPTESGTLKWVDGPVVSACRIGASCLISEYNVIDPGMTTGLNLMLEGYSWTIPETGETITPHPLTRFYVTQNAADSRAAVSGRNVTDVANDSRFFNIYKGYMAPEKEEALVLRVLNAASLPNHVAPAEIARIVVQVANDVRGAYNGNTNSIGGQVNSRELVLCVDKPFDTRSLIRWAKLTVMYSGPMKAKGLSGMHYALPRAFKMTPEMHKAVNELVTARLGVDENLH